MRIYYDKHDSWKIDAPNTIALLSAIIKSETNKKFINLKQCAKIVYTLNQSVTLWSENEYKEFIGRFDVDLASHYMTVSSNQKGQFRTINRNNTETLRNDFIFLCRLFTNILTSMIMDGKKKLFIEG
jgi:hypothetical protein